MLWSNSYFGLGLVICHYVESHMIRLCVLTVEFNRISLRIMADVITQFFFTPVMISKTDSRKIDALDQWCLRMLLDIKWYQFVRNDDVRRLTKQPKLTAYYAHGRQVPKGSC